MYLLHIHDIYIYIYNSFYTFMLIFYIVESLQCILNLFFSQSYISIPPEISEKRKEHINATLITARNIAKVKKIY